MRYACRAVAIALATTLAVAGSAEAAGRPGVAALQVALRAHGLYQGTVDGYRGPGTGAAVQAFQSNRGLAVDGVAGRQTRRALGRLGRHRYRSRTLSTGAVGWDVSALQFKLAWRGFPSGAFDGHFGARTAAALQRFQRWSGLGADGVAGSATYEALTRPIPSSSVAFARPVSGVRGDGFGPRGNRFHTGVDFAAGYGVPVFAARPGRVRFAAYDSGGYGNLVIIRHGGGVTSWYAHLNRVRVSAGTWVGQSARIGDVGSTGFSTGPHLHFEVRVRGAAVAPPV
jgi:peptidoglycan hydrolase-like protein with peptidoglycan-binding domain